MRQEESQIRASKQNPIIYKPGMASRTLQLWRQSHIHAGCKKQHNCSVRACLSMEAGSSGSRRQWAREWSGSCSQKLHTCCPQFCVKERCLQSAFLKEMCVNSGASRPQRVSFIFRPCLRFGASCQYFAWRRQYFCVDCCCCCCSC